MRRDVISEIVQRRARELQRVPRWEHVTRRMLSVMGALDEIKARFPRSNEARSELLRYIPIALVSSTEGFFRIAVRELIDECPQYLPNISKLDLGPLPMEALVAIHGRQVSLGEFVSHSMKVKSLESVNSFLSRLTDCDFLSDVKTVRINPHDRPNAVSIESRAASIFKGVTETFRYRHIFSHELGTKERFGIRLADWCSESCLMFLIASEAFVRRLIHSRPTAASRRRGKPRG
jgi:hypothetical protein